MTVPLSQVDIQTYVDALEEDAVDAADLIAIAYRLGVTLIQPSASHSTPTNRTVTLANPQGLFIGDLIEIRLPQRSRWNYTRGHVERFMKMNLKIKLSDGRFLNVRPQYCFPVNNPAPFVAIASAIIDDTPTLTAPASRPAAKTPFKSTLQKPSGKQPKVKGLR